MKQSRSLMQNEAQRMVNGGPPSSTLFSSANPISSFFSLLRRIAHSILVAPYSDRNKLEVTKQNITDTNKKMSLISGWQLESERLIRAVPPKVIRAVFERYSVSDTVLLLKSVTIETQSFLMSCFEPESSTANTLKYYLDAPENQHIRTLEGKILKDFLVDLARWNPHEEQAIVIKKSAPLPKTLAPPPFPRPQKLLPQSSRASLTLSRPIQGPAPTLIKMVLVYSYENPEDSSKKTADFLKGLGLDFDEENVKQIWRDFDLLEVNQRIAWVTMGEEDMCTEHQKASEFIRDQM